MGSIHRAAMTRVSSLVEMLFMIKLPRRAACLPGSFYARSTEIVARELIGKALLHKVDGQWIGGIIVETEAYLASDDPASHSARGQTKSNASMFASPGTLYVYPIHAKYCMNAVTGPIGEGTAVLIRALEPIWGIAAMQTSRGQQDLRRLTRGPAMLCQSLSVDRQHDGLCLVRNTGFRVACTGAEPNVATTERIGISKAVDRQLRFVDQDSRYLSRPL